MNSPKSLLLLLAVCISTLSFAQQNTSTIDVNKDVDLIVVYEAYVADGYGTPEIYKKLANGNYFKDNYKAAAKWYEKLFETESPINKIHAYRYKQSLKVLKRDIASNPYLANVQ